MSFCSTFWEYFCKLWRNIVCAKFCQERQLNAACAGLNLSLSGVKTFVHVVHDSVYFWVLAALGDLNSGYYSCFVCWKGSANVSRIGSSLSECGKGNDSQETVHTARQTLQTILFRKSNQEKLPLCEGCSAQAPNSISTTIRPSSHLKSYIHVVVPTGLTDFAKIMHEIRS